MSTPIDPDGNRIVTLLAALDNPDSAIRFNAGLDLVKLGNLAGIPALIEGFEHESTSVRLFHASKTLVGLGTPAIPALEAALSAPNPQVRVDAAYTLWQIDNTRLDSLLPVAIAIIESDNHQAATDALTFLGEIGTPAQIAVPTLIDALRADSIASKTVPWFDDKRIFVAALLAKIKEPVTEIVPALIQALEGESSGLRWGAACALGEIGTEAASAIPALAAVIRNESEVELVRVEAAYALAVIGDPSQESLPVLLDIYRSAEWWIRAFAVRILGQIGATANLYPPIEAFGWLDRFLMAVRNVQQVDKPEEQVVPTLIQALHDPDYNVRRNAAYALSQIGASANDAIPALIAALSQPDMAPLAAETLAKIGTTTIPALREALVGENELARATAAYAFKLIATPEAQSSLNETVEPPTRAFVPTIQHFYLQVPVSLDAEQCAAFESLYQMTIATGKGNEVHYTLPYPKHHFLRYVVEHKDCLMHGSGKVDIDVLKPMRYGIDANDHGNVSGIYADRDFVRPIYFAVIDGKRAFGQNNGFFDLTVDGKKAENEDQGFDRRYYKLAIGVNGLRHNPWRNGMIYILPPDTFEYWNEWTSRSPVQPLMRLAVTPDDLPLRADVWGSDWRTFDGDNWVKPDDPFPFLKDVRTTAILPAGRPAWLAVSEGKYQ